MHIIALKAKMKFWLLGCFCFSFLCGGPIQWMLILHYSLHYVGNCPYRCYCLICREQLLLRKKYAVIFNSVCSWLNDCWFLLIKLKSFQNWVFWFSLCIFQNSYNIAEWLLKLELDLGLVLSSVISAPAGNLP